MLNSIAADALEAFADELEKAEDFESAMRALVRREMTAHQRIIFNGNGYTDEWVAEAARRGLPNIGSMVDAIPELVKPASVALFARQGVYTEKELLARADVSYELYAKTVNIEALTMIDMAGKDIIPAVVEYTGKLAWSVNQAAQAGVDAFAQKELLPASMSCSGRHTARWAICASSRRRQRHSPSGAGEILPQRGLPAMQVLRAPGSIIWK